MDKTLQGIKGRFTPERRHDKNQEKRKIAAGAVCGECMAVYDGKRWTWKAPIEGAAPALCPACLRTADRYPAGTISLGGEFFQDHREEILNLVRNVEALEKGEHPLERIMDIEESSEGVMITTTGIHVARRIGEALGRSYQGQYSMQYAEGERSVNIEWTR